MKPQASPSAAVPAPDLIETTLLPVGRPVHRRRTPANSWWYQGNLVTPLLSGPDTQGAFALLDMSLQRGAETPTHTHQREDETVFVLEGRLCYHVGNEELHAGPGDTVYLPRGVPHSFCLHTDYAWVLLHIMPAGLEEFYRAQAEPAGALVVPPLPMRPHESHIMALASRFGLSFE